MIKTETEVVVIESSDCCQQPTTMKVVEGGKIFMVCNHCKRTVKNVTWKLISIVKNIGANTQ